MQLLFERHIRQYADVQLRTAHNRKQRHRQRQIRMKRQTHAFYRIMSLQQQHQQMKLTPK